MSEQPETGETTEEQPVTLEMEITDGRTEIRVSGDRDTAVIVQSESGEKIYLPPEDFDRPAREQTAYASPYQSGSGSQETEGGSQETRGGSQETRGGSQESPYDTGPDTDSTVGLTPTADGYVLVHPEPVTDIRFLR